VSNVESSVDTSSRSAGAEKRGLERVDVFEVGSDQSVRDEKVSRSSLE
jgi:hypothetical protein